MFFNATAYIIKRIVYRDDANPLFFFDSFQDEKPKSLFHRMIFNCVTFNDCKMRGQQPFKVLF